MLFVTICGNNTNEITEICELITAESLITLLYTTFIVPRGQITVQ